MKRVTLKNLADSTEMEVFQFVKNHLLTQKEHSYSEIRGECAYKTKSGLKCAVGCLMTSREYKKSFETFAWADLVERELVPSAHKLLIVDLQRCHDSEEVENWEDELNKIEDKIKRGWYTQLPF